MIDPAAISPDKSYLITGNDLRDLLEAVKRQKPTGTLGQINVSEGPDGTKFSFASEQSVVIISNGDEVEMLIPMRPAGG